jgi:hypothetical protein
MPTPQIDPNTGEVVGQSAANVQIDPATGEVITAPKPKPTMLQKAMTTASDLGVGALKGAGSTANSIGHIIYPDWLAKRITGAPSAEQQESYFAPKNTAQSIGKGAEQIGEFLLPGGAEERGAEKLAEFTPKLGAMAKPLARALTSGVSSGAVNAAQGGSFGTGAALGAGGSAAGAGLRALAPKIAESALGIGKADRAFSKTPGKAIIEETQGVRPETIAKTGRSALENLNKDLEGKAASSTEPMSLQPARQFLSDKMAQAEDENAEGLHGQINNMANMLYQRFGTGQPIPQDVPALEGLKLKRGFGEEHTSWNPEIKNQALSSGRQAYGLLDRAFDQAVPGGKELNQRISSLIPAVKRAESATRNPTIMQRVGGRIAARTGALTMGAMGGAEGYRTGGVPGAIAGGTMGLLVPEMLADPEAQMIAARMAAKAKNLKPLVGTIAQATSRSKDKGGQE